MNNQTPNATILLTIVFCIGIAACEQSQKAAEETIEGVDTTLVAVKDLTDRVDKIVDEAKRTTMQLSEGQDSTEEL